MNWNQTRLSPFTFTNRQHARVQIDVFFIQVQALAQTHPSDAEQANESSIGFRSDPLRRVRCRDCFEKLLNLIRCVNVWPSSPVSILQKPGGGISVRASMPL
jgi:hypothetical protein